jgi:hypothetical protein
MNAIANLVSARMTTGKFDTMAVSAAQMRYDMQSMTGMNLAGMFTRNK